jgi:predicted transcriptional regulator
MDKLKNGDLIKVNYSGKEASAKFLKLNGDGTKMNVVVQARLQWLPVSDFIGMGEKEEKGQEPKKEVKASKETKVKTDSPKPEKKAKKQPETSADETKGDASEETTSEKKEAEKPVKLSAHQIKILEAIKDAKLTEINEIAMRSGILNPQIRKAADGLIKSGYLIIEETEQTGTHYQLTETGIQLIENQNNQNTEIMAKKKVTKKAPAKVVKAKKEGKVELSKKDQIIALLKNKDLTITDVAEKMDTDVNYVREIKASIQKKMDEPDKDSKKGKVFKMLQSGKSAKEIAVTLKVSSVYVYKIKGQMTSAGVL